MLNNKIDHFIQSASISELSEWIKDNPNLIFRSMDGLMNRFGNISNESAAEISELITALINTTKFEMTENQFNLIEMIVHRIISSGVTFTNEELSANPILFLTLVFATSHEIVNGLYKLCDIEVVAGTLYMVLLDIYYPHDNPMTLSDTLVSYYPIDQMIEHANDTSWVQKNYEKNELSKVCAYKDILLMFKYVSDIYSNREAKLDFFYRYIRLVTGAYAYNEMFRAIESRYQRYFGEDTSYVIVTTLQMLDNVAASGQTGIESYVRDVYNLKVPYDVMKCFINDVDNLLYYIPNHSFKRSEMYDKVYVTNALQSLWNDNSQVETYQYEASDESFIDLSSPYNDFEDIATEAVHKDSAVINAAEKNIYKAYRTYKGAEEKVDSQITKACQGIKKVLIGDVRTEVIEGKEFSAIGLLKKFLGTVGIFSIGPIKGLIATVIKYALKKKTSVSERRKIIMELETELKMIDEKIQDAKSDNNREAKYAMMRTKAELENALKKIEYGLEADQRSLSTAKATINKVRGGE